MFPSMEAMSPGEHGLIGLGGDLAPKTVLEAYKKGLFPWEGHPPIPWFSPNPRLILRPQDVRESRTVRRLRKSVNVHINQQFRNVMIRCATVPRPGQDGTWISQAMIGSYVELHFRGWAHSIEIVMNKRLVGGLYGLAIGRAFFGESMFQMLPNASKLALVHLCQLLETDSFAFIDCQQNTPHLRSMGAQPISRDDYLNVLKEAIHPTEKWLPS